MTDQEQVAWVEHIDGKPVELHAAVKRLHDGHCSVAWRPQTESTLAALVLPTALLTELCKDAIRLAQLRWRRREKLAEASP